MSSLTRRMQRAHSEKRTHPTGLVHFGDKLGVCSKTCTHPKKETKA